METSHNLKPIFSGIQKFSSIDDHGHLGIILFTGGCNFRCKYCYNPEFVLPNKIKYLNIEEIKNLLNKRKEVLESVIICGGEPTVHPNLPEWLKFIRSLGYRIKLDTNGTNPKMISKLIKEKLIDYVAIDYKAPIKKYESIIQTKINSENIKESISLLIENNIGFECRTTVHSELTSYDDIVSMMCELKNLGVEKYYLQAFMNTQKKLYNLTNAETESKKLINDFKNILGEFFEEYGIRNNA